MDKKEQNPGEKEGFLGRVEFIHSNYSGYEEVEFYRNEEGQLYHRVSFFDLSDEVKVNEVKPCKLKEEEMRRLLEEKAVEDYRRFYWD